MVRAAAAHPKTSPPTVPIARRYIAAPPASGLTLAYYGQALQAAADGTGVAMGIRPYIDDDLAAGRLVAPFKQAVPKGHSWYLLVRPGRETEPSFQAFRSWILRAVTAR